MADIDLERKRKRSWWPWVLALLVAILAIWAVAEVLEDDEVPMASDEIVAPAPLGPQSGPAAEMGPAGEGAAGAVTDFRQRCVQATDDQDMSRQHQWTVSCLESMAAALEATIQADTVGSIALQERLETLRQRANDVRRSDASATTHAATVSAAFDAGADLIETYQEERGATGAEYAQDVQEAADRLSAEGQLLEQREAVQSFFESVGNALQSMSTNQPANAR